MAIRSMTLCDYGCGKQAKYQFKNGKFCCSSKFQSCIGHINNKRDKIRNYVIIYYRNENEKQKQKRIDSHKKFWNDNNRKVWSERALNYNKKNKRTIEGLLHKYPIFSDIENLRYNPDKPDKKEIQVHCKNHECNNSKENNGWFTPSSRQLEWRIEALEHGSGGRNFYCSDECKQQCPLYRANPNNYLDFLNDNDEIPYTQSEYIIFKSEVILRQINQYNYNFCEKCEKILTSSIYVHHEKSKKLYPIFSLDPDNGIILCQACHIQIHTGDCSGFSIAKKCQEKKING